jgi:FtsH-binding integral membrane protein
MTNPNSNPFAIGFMMVGVLVLCVALVVHFLTENPTGLYLFSLGFLVIGVLFNLSED